MPQMNLEIIKVSKPEKVKKYETIEVTYKDLTNGGKVAGKKLVSFGDYKHVYDYVKDMAEENTATVQYEKVNDFWTWVKIGPIEGLGNQVATPEGDKGPVRAAKQTWVADEVKQRLIVRQSCLAQAVAFERDNSPGEVDVLKTAERFVDWVFEVNKTDVAVAELPKAKKAKQEKVEVL